MRSDVAMGGKNLGIRQVLLIFAEGCRDLVHVLLRASNAG